LARLLREPSPATRQERRQSSRRPKRLRLQRLSGRLIDALVTGYRPEAVGSLDYVAAGS